MLVKRGNGITKRIKVIAIEGNRVTITWEDGSQTVYFHNANFDKGV